MADFAAFNQAVQDLVAEVAADVANTDQLWQDYQTAVSGGADQSTIDAATQALNDQIQKLKDDVAAHTAP